MSTKEQIPELYTSEDCLPESFDMDWNDKILVIHPDKLSPDYRRPAFQLWRGDGGFGCSPRAVGTAVFAVCLADEERARWSRADFLGVLKPELYPIKINIKAEIAGTLDKAVKNSL